MGEKVNELAVNTVRKNINRQIKQIFNNPWNRVKSRFEVVSLKWPVETDDKENPMYSKID